MVYTLGMDAALKHIVRYVNNKGIQIEYINGNSSEFRSRRPNTLFISRTSTHGRAAAILHEYYHARQWKRGKLYNGSMTEDAHQEYKAELFVIRCFNKLGMVYNKAFIESVWRDRPDDWGGEYYPLAYELLEDEGVLK